MRDVDKSVDQTFDADRDDKLLLDNDFNLSDEQSKESMSKLWGCLRTNKYLRAAVVVAIVALGVILALVLLLNTSSGSLSNRAEEEALMPTTFAPIGQTNSSAPSASPSISSFPSVQPSPLPSSTPSVAPTHMPSLTPTHLPSQTPTGSPSETPTNPPSASPTESLQVTTFYAVGDVPYTDEQADLLEQQMLDLPSDAEFLIHVGDLRHAAPELECHRSDYEKAAEILRLSRAPVFVILGDNDWNDCPNIDEGLRHWKDEFLNFESRNWKHSFDIAHQIGRPENFAFTHKGTLFVGLSIVGGTLNSPKEWKERLQSQATWTIELIENYIDEISPRIGRVVIFGHADPGRKHSFFFNPLVKFIKNYLKNQVPILYVNGDNHFWLHQPNFMEQESLLRIMVNAKAEDPPLQIQVFANGTAASTAEAFLYDRRLPDNT